jgi:hypothetical protein
MRQQDPTVMERHSPAFPQSGLEGRSQFAFDLYILALTLSDEEQIAQVFSRIRQSPGPAAHAGLEFPRLLVGVRLNQISLARLEVDSTIVNSRPDYNFLLRGCGTGVKGLVVVRCLVEFPPNAHLHLLALRQNLVEYSIELLIDEAFSKSEVE